VDEQKTMQIDLNIRSLPFRYTLSIIGGKWKMLILYIIAEQQPIRYNELQRRIGKITYLKQEHTSLFTAIRVAI